MKYIVKYIIPGSSFPSLTTPIQCKVVNTKREAEEEAKRLKEVHPTTSENGKELDIVYYVEETIKIEKKEVLCSNMKVLEKNTQTSSVGSSFSGQSQIDVG